MENRLKERLTGAAILVALIVLVVPEMFHGQRTASPGHAVAAGDGLPQHSYTIELDANQGGTLGMAPLKAPAVKAPAVKASAMKVPATASRPAAVAAVPAAIPSPRVPAPTRPGALAATPAPAPPTHLPSASTAARGPDLKAGSATVKPVTVAATARKPGPASTHVAKTEGPETPPDAPGAAAGGSWSVQLGLFSKAANAQRLLSTAHAKGFAVRLSRTGPRQLYRVAIGGLDHSDAERLSRRLHEVGLPAAIMRSR